MDPSIALSVCVCVFAVCIEDYRALLSTLLVRQQLQQSDNPTTTATRDPQLLQPRGEPSSSSHTHSHWRLYSTEQSRAETQTSFRFIYYRLSRRAFVNFSRFCFDSQLQLQLQLTNDPLQQIGFYQERVGVGVGVGVGSRLDRCIAEKLKPSDNSSGHTRLKINSLTQRPYPGAWNGNECLSAGAFESAAP